MEKHLQFIQTKLDQMASQNRLRSLQFLSSDYIDFFSNDYLGFSTKGLLHVPSQEISNQWIGATGSRLISGNHPEMIQVEEQFARYLRAPSALLYNSGYMANTGLLSALGDKNSCFVYDEHVHASIKEGMRLGFGSKIAFRHNDIEDLQKKLIAQSKKDLKVYVLTEGLFSMHGDVPPIREILEICARHEAALIVDEAHALGTLGEDNKGLSYSYADHPNLFARIITFGKAAGCHGAMVLGSCLLREFLINFSRAFIYTTAPSSDQVATISASLKLFAARTNSEKLSSIIHYYTALVKEKSTAFSQNPGPIQYWQCADIGLLKQKVEKLKQAGINCYPILSPTVKPGEERIRIILHAFNTKEELSLLIQLLES
ncbi:aminotransferase class I/II-fold pyridoxal phosphate-dependent enzyme [Echinicola pacifica]|nr:aminotransferase class I/II-fold pyridoxal phosphate-dependent enzyme [Echinicola pacifica]